MRTQISGPLSQICRTLQLCVSDFRFAATSSHSTIPQKRIHNYSAYMKSFIAVIIRLCIRVEHRVGSAQIAKATLHVTKQTIVRPSHYVHVSLCFYRRVCGQGVQQLQCQAKSITTGRYAWYALRSSMSPGQNSMFRLYRCRCVALLPCAAWMHAHSFDPRHQDSTVRLQWLVCRLQCNIYNM